MRHVTPYITAALIGAVCGLLLLALISLTTGCAKKKPVILPRVPMRVSYFKGTCVKQLDGSYICKARFDPQEIEAKPF